MPCTAPLTAQMMDPWVVLIQKASDGQAWCPWGAGDYYFNDPMLESADCRIAENGKAKINGEASLQPVRTGAWEGRC